MKLVSLITCLLFYGECHKTPDRSTELQLLLDSALSDDKPIVLVAGDDFLSPPGTVIFLSRRKGMERMVSLARQNEPELAMLYLPKWQAWITQSVYRESDEVRIDGRYLASALASGIEAEHWHTHNNLDSNISLSSTEPRRQSLESTMPSPEDLRQLYLYDADYPEAKFSGVIASIYGALTFWNHDPRWTVPIHVGYAVMQDAHKLHLNVSELSIDNLPKFASQYKGYVKLSFELVP